MDEIKATDLCQLLRGRMGLIIGPSITKHPESFTDVNNALAEKGGIEAENTYIATGDVLLDKGISPDLVQEWIRDAVGQQTKSSLLSHINKVRWKAALSASLDAHFEDGFRQEADRRAAWQPVTVLTDMTTPPPPRTTPVFKLLGLATRDGFAYSTVSYLDRRATWRHAVKGFGDLVKGNPVLCLGMGDATWTLIDLITEMIGERSAIPSALLLLADDPVCGNVKVRQLLHKRAKVLVVRGTAGDVARAASDAEAHRFTPSLLFADAASSDDPLTKLRGFDDVTAIVNDHLSARIAKTEHHQLRDLLFSPSITRWDPFVHEIDFRRTLGATLLARISDALETRNTEGGACILSGGAVTGKTVLLKRLAWDLAKKGALVLWLKPSSYQDGPRFLRELFKEVAEVGSAFRHQVVVVMDDPLGFGSLTSKDVVLAAKAHDVPIMLISGVRTSELGAWERHDLVGGLPVAVQGELPDALDETEWESLSKYLVSLGVATDESSAKASISGISSHSSRDTLSMLYWLLPETRASIGSSIRDEYHRLGDVAGLTKVILGAVNQGTTILKTAYEMVSVADHYRASLPMEVLVSALGIPYSEWRDATGEHSSAWGLLYCEESDDSDTVSYRTRNSIVTRMIVEAINGGTLGRTGELRVLTTMLRACSGRSSPVYREFCVRVLVPHEKLMRLEYEEGLKLYDEAIAALPHSDKTLLHHKGLWIKNKGGNAALATEILEEALQAPVYPYAQRGEADGHIHTSIAAAVLDGINQGLETVEDGKKKILDHLSKSRASDYFNPRAVHVQANLISHLADKVPDAHSPDYFAMINRAVGDVEDTLMILQSEVMRSSHKVAEVEMLQEIRDAVLVKVHSQEDLNVEAERIWKEIGSQEGFVLAARKLYATARIKDKKYNDAFSYCLHVIERITEAGAVPSPALHTVVVQIYYQWKVRRQMMSGNSPIAWDTLRDHCFRVISSAEYQNDPLYKHIYALSLAHLGKWSEANALYSQLRQANIPGHILWTARDYLLNETGGIRTVQGVMRSHANRDFLFCEDLGTDFYVDKKSRWPRAGEIAHAAIQFSFGGQTAIEYRQ